jgi:uncharacterized protein YndB with AHSA1/START domain
VSLSLSMTASRLISAPREKVWPAFLEMMGWDQMQWDEDHHPSLELCFRPMGKQVIAEAIGLDTEPGRRLSWKGKAGGISVRRDFIFRGAPGGTLVESREQVSGLTLLFLRPFYSPKAMGQANQAWLEQLAERVEN